MEQKDKDHKRWIAREMERMMQESQPDATTGSAVDKGKDMLSCL